MTALLMPRRSCSKRSQIWRDFSAPSISRKWQNIAARMAARVLFKCFMSRMHTGWQCPTSAVMQAQWLYMTACQQQSDITYRNMSAISGNVKGRKPHFNLPICSASPIHLTVVCSHWLLLQTWVMATTQLSPSTKWKVWGHIWSGVWRMGKWIPFHTRKGASLSVVASSRYNNHHCTAFAKCLMTRTWQWFAVTNAANGTIVCVWE